MKIANKSIGTGELTALIVGSAIGSGIFGVTSDLARAAAPGPALLGWIIVGLGMGCLVASFNHLLRRRPDLHAGIFDYAGAAFGSLGEFIAGWAYWLASWLGNIAFATIAMSALGTFWPIFRGGQNWPSIILAIVLTWVMTIIVSYGVETTALINTVGTLAKLVPILLFVIIVAFNFKFKLFTLDFWGKKALDGQTMSFFSQVKSSLMVMMWLFMGIESASVMGHRAKNQQAAAKASLGGWLTLLLIYILVSLLPYGVMSRAELARSSQPALGAILQQLVGPWGANMISIGLLVAVLIAWLSWTMLPAEALMMMAQNHVLPKEWGKLNAHRAPINALVITAVIQTLFLFSLPFTTYAYRFAYTLGTVAGLIVYLFVGLYQIKYSWRHHETGQLIIGILLTIFEVLTLSLAGWRQVLILSVSLLPGFIIYRQARHEQNEPLSLREKQVMVIVALLAIVSLILIAKGTIPIE